MLDGVPVGIPAAIALVCAGGWGLAAYFARLVYTGRLVPRSTMEDVEHDRSEWRAESRIKDTQIAVKDEQLRHLAEVGRTVEAIMRAVEARAQAAPPDMPGADMQETP